MTDYRAMCAELIEAIDSETADWEDMEELKARARALLDQQEPAPQLPAEGEVAELLEWLREQEAMAYAIEDIAESRRYARIADLLQHPEPVAVSERQPGPEHCDKWGQCWTTDYDPSLVYSPVWKMTELPRQHLGHDFSNAYFWRNVRFWLPANALPTPEATNG